jgi:hypothetical protein
MSSAPTYTPLGAAEYQLAELERIELEEGPMLTNHEASDLADLRNRRDGAHGRHPRWEIRELPNHDCIVVDVDEEARLEAAWVARHGDVEEPGS